VGQKPNRWNVPPPKQGGWKEKSPSPEKRSLKRRRVEKGPLLREVGPQKERLIPPRGHKKGAKKFQGGKRPTFTGPTKVGPLGYETLHTHKALHLQRKVRHKKTFERGAFQGKEITLVFPKIRPPKPPDVPIKGK